MKDEEIKIIGSVLTVRPANAEIDKTAKASADISHADAVKLLERIIEENDNRRNAEVSTA